MGQVVPIAVEGERVWAAVILTTAAWPLAVAWRSNAHTTLRPTLTWALVAWAAWWNHAVHEGPLTAYAALTLTGAAFVAVLGARRPGVVAWNFVVAGFLVVAWLGWAEGLLTGGGLKLGPVRLGLIAAVWLTGTGNYLLTPSCLGGLALLAAGGLAFEHLRIGHPAGSVTLACSLAGVAPWLAWLGLTWRPVPATAPDQEWQQFRDRFGAIWALRLAEQFNRAAANAGWPVRLGWFGFQPPGAIQFDEGADALAALQRRFRVGAPGASGA